MYISSVAGIPKKLCTSVFASATRTYVRMQSTGQTIATFGHNISQHCWPSVCKPLPNGVKALGTRFCNIVRRKKGATSWARLAILIGRVATCWVLKNRGNAYAQAQRCCTNLVKRLHHHTISTNVA